MTFRAAAIRRSKQVGNIYAGLTGELPQVGDIGTVWFSDEAEPVPAVCTGRDTRARTYDIAIVEGGTTNERLR